MLERLSGVEPPAVAPALRFAQRLGARPGGCGGVPGHGDVGPRHDRLGPGHHRLADRRPDDQPVAPTGAIVLAHLGGYRTGEALPTIVRVLRDNGYTMTTVSDLRDG